MGGTEVTEVTRTGRPPKGERAMTNAERCRASRARARARRHLALPAEAVDAAIMSSVIAGTRRPPPELVAAVRAAEPAAAPAPPPPLPDDPAARAAAIAAEIELTLRAAALDPSTPAASRIAAARSLGELHGLLKTRAAVVDPAEAAERRQMDPEWLAAEAAATRREVKRLQAALGHAVEEPMPWD
jgi:hypothetical protein